MNLRVDYQPVNHFGVVMMAGKQCRSGTLHCILFPPFNGHDYDDAIQLVTNTVWHVRSDR